MAAETVQLLDLVGLIYDAVLEPDIWNHVMEKAAGFVGGMGASLFRQDMIRKVGNSYYSYGMDHDFEQLYFKKYIHQNPLGSALLTVEVGHVTSSSELIPPAAFFETKFYKEWAKPQGLIDNVFCILERSATSASSFIVFRHERDGLTNARTFERFNAIAPHVRRAALIGNVLQEKVAEAREFTDLLDHVRAGVFVVDTRGTVGYSNKAGRELVAAADCLRVVAGKLSARAPEANQLLQEAFRAAADGDAAINSKCIAVPLMGIGDSRYVANLLPLTRRRRSGIGSNATSALFVHRAALELPDPPEVIANTFKLTKAELRVLLALVELGGGPQIAEALGIGNGTVKTHLRSLFRKTGAKHQADLVRVVAGFSRLND